MRALAPSISALFLTIFACLGSAQAGSKCSDQLGHFDGQALAWVLTPSDVLVKRVFEQAAIGKGHEFEEFVAKLANLAFVDAKLAQPLEVAQRVAELDSEPASIAVLCEQFSEAVFDKPAIHGFEAFQHATAAAFLAEPARTDVRVTGSPIVAKAVALKIVDKEFAAWRKRTPGASWFVTLIEGARGFVEIVFTANGPDELSALRESLGGEIQGIKLRFDEGAR